MAEEEKIIDESWKEKIAKEKEEIRREEKPLPPEVDFSLFITTIAAQVSIALGNIPNPITNEKEVNLEQAKFLIDTLGLLKEKTKGNLTEEETNLLENILYELRMEYISKQKGV